MAGYAVGQITAALVSDRIISKWTCLRCLIKGLIVSGMLCSVATDVYFFAISWWVVAFTASTTFLIVATHLLQRLEDKNEAKVEWKGRFLAGLLFQLNWTSSRFLAAVIVYFSTHWITVMSIITILVSLAYFALESLIWKTEKGIIEGFFSILLVNQKVAHVTQKQLTEELGQQCDQPAPQGLHQGRTNLVATATTDSS